MTEIRDQKNQCWGGPLSSSDDDDDDDDDAWSVPSTTVQKTFPAAIGAQKKLRRWTTIHDHSTKQRKSEENKKNAHTRTHTHTHT